MAKKDEFKIFAAKHPELVKYIKNKETTWQNLYEIYDIYGEEASAWEDYINNSNTTTSTNKKANDYNIKSFTDKLKNIDFNSIQEHISTAQKALGIVQELTSKGTGAAVATTTAEVVEPRPINKIFED